MTKKEDSLSARKMLAKANYERLTQLHERHLANPPSGAEYAKAIEMYKQAVQERDFSERTTQWYARRQKKIAVQKRAMLEKHRRLKERMKAEEQAMATNVSETHQELRKAGERAEQARNLLSEAAEDLVLAHGSSAISLNGVTHDFGCYGSKVYLVPRSKKKKQRRAP